MKTINDLPEETKQFIDELHQDHLAQSQKDIIRILDDDNHLLCCYNRITHCIEIHGQNRGGNHSTRRKKYSINVDILKRQGMSNYFSDSPVFEFRAEIISEETNGR